MSFIKNSIFIFFIFLSISSYLIIPKKLALMDCSKIDARTKLCIAQKLSEIKFYSKDYWDCNIIYNFLNTAFPGIDYIKVYYQNGVGFIKIYLEEPAIKIGTYILTNKKKLVPISHYNAPEIQGLPEIFIAATTDIQDIQNINEIHENILPIFKDYEVYWVSSIEIILVPKSNSVYQTVLISDLNNLDKTKINNANKVNYIKDLCIDIRFKDIYISKKLSSLDLNILGRNMKELIEEN